MVKGNRKKSKNKKSSDKKNWKQKFWAIFGGICLVMGFLGLSIKDLLNKDWQAIAERYNTQGLELYNASSYSEAIDFYDKAISLESKGIYNIDVVYYNRGMAYYKIEDYQHAIGDLSIAIDLNPRKLYYENRAMVYQLMGNIEKAAADTIQAALAK